MRTLLLSVCLILSPAAPASGAPAAPAAGKVFMSVDEALALAFPECDVAQHTAYLTRDERARAKKLAGVAVPQAVVRYYVAKKEGHLVGTAYVEAHKVRTMKETVLIVVDPESRIQRFELLSFAEPPEYIPRGSWYHQLLGHRLDDGLNLDRDIRGVAGATLTARATTRSARRVLALHEVLGAKAGHRAGFLR